MSDEAPHPTGSPKHYGGQALLEGVMMRGAEHWALAVRRPSGEIYRERHRVTDFPQRHPLFRKPMFRGVAALVDAMAIGAKALTISARQSMPEDEEELSGKEIAGGLALALVLFIGIFIVLPNFGLAFAHRFMPNETTYHVVEGLLRVGMFVGYIAAISLLPDIRRVFAYHGAEHKTIAAWEHGEVLTPERVDRYSTLHVRCGTNFLFLVLAIAIFVYSIAGAIWPTPDGGIVIVGTYHIVLRIVLLPVVAGLAYEGLRLGAQRDNLVIRAMMKPGLWLQMITTRPPERDMIEVAIRAFEAAAPSADTDGRIDATLPAPLVWGPEEDPQAPALAADERLAVDGDEGRPEPGTGAGAPERGEDPGPDT